MPTLAEILANKAKTSTGTVIRAGDTGSVEVPTKALPPTPRELGAIDQGERVPLDYPTEDQGWEWFRSCHAFESDMGIVIEPGSVNAWLAVQSPGNQTPILLLRLPLLNRSEGSNPF
jgi:hypothetical protein